MKKRLVLVLALVMVFTMVLAACTATPDAPTGDGGGGAGSSGGDSGGGGGGDGGDGAVSSESAYDQIMKLLENPESALALNGIQPKEYPSRASVPKGLPVASKAAADVKLAWAASQLGSEFFEGLRDSAQAEAAKLGLNPIDLRSADLSLETQNQQIDDFVTQGIDILLLNPIDLHAQAQIIKEVSDKGIPVILTAPTAAKPEYQLITTIISGSNESGFVVGEYAAQELYKPGEVVKMGMVVAKLEDADSNSRPCGFIAGWLSVVAAQEGAPYASKYDAILEAFNIWTVYKSDRKYDLSDRGLNLAWLGVGEGLDVAKGQQACADQLTGNPDTNLILAEMDSMGYGVIQECKQQGKTPGQDIFVITGANGARQALDYIRSGELMATATNIPFIAASALPQIAFDLLVGGRPAAPDAANTPEKAAEYYNDLPATSFMPTMIINKDNVDKYYPTAPDTQFDGTFALYDPWTPISIPEYNELHKND